MSDVQLRTKAWFGDEPLSINFPPAWNIVRSVLRTPRH